MNLIKTVILIIAVSLVGCASATTGMERGDRTMATLETVQSDIQLTLNDIDDVETSLEELIRLGQRDVDSAFERYSNSVDELENNGTRFQENMGSLNSQAEDYFAGWESEIGEFENPQLRQLSEQRRQEVLQEYEQINQAASGVEGDLHSYIRNNKEIRTFLSNDLTSQGIESITLMVEDVIDDSSDLRRRLIRVQNAIGETHESMERQGRQID